MVFSSWCAFSMRRTSAVMKTAVFAAIVSAFLVRHVAACVFVLVLSWCRLLDMPRVGRDENGRLCGYRRGCSDWGFNGLYLLQYFCPGVAWSICCSIFALVLPGRFAAVFLPWCRLLDGCTASGRQTLAFAAMLAAALIGDLVACICELS